MSEMARSPSAENEKAHGTSNGSSKENEVKNGVIGDQKPSAPQIDHFEILKHIGSGAYGEVAAVQKTIGTDSGQMYAMKVMEKKRMSQHKDMVEHEWKILTTIRSPFFMKMKYSFQTNRHLVFIMPLAGGGDMLTLMEKGCLSEEHAQFYICELVVGVGYLHENKIIHRDVKLENLLIGNDGHMLITDYGLSATGENEDEIEGVIGTRHTMAPEIYLKKRYGPACDWWAVGITYCDMRSELPCFDDADSHDYSESTAKKRPRLPKVLSPRERGFLNKLIVRDPALRLGNGPDGTAAIKNHHFFKNVDWEEVANKKLVPPFVPCAEEISTFKCFPDATKNAAFPTFEHPVPLYWDDINYTAEDLL